jgi:nitrite reductase/ring-hydroxylating ferredoxin subunit
MDVQRRTVLQASGIIAVGGLVAACSSGGGSAASATTAGTGSSGAGAVAQTADVPVGGGLIIADPAVVITQPADGEFKAFTAICTHQGCLVSEVVNNEIICPCHGSKFSATDGAVINGPAQTPLAPAAVTVDGTSIVLT